MSEEMVPDTEMSRFEYLIAFEHSDRNADDNVNIENVDENGTTSTECIHGNDDSNITPERIQLTAIHDPLYALILDKSLGCDTVSKAF